MFEGLVKSKFYTKCKSAIKLMNTRVEIIKKKRNAMLKYMKADIADLLRSGLDINAYGRVEGLIAEMNLSACYDLVDQFSVQILNNLAVISKQRECPEECREAVASLMYAAARLADLPELRELRTVFAQRYGNSVDCFVSKELVERFKPTPPTKDMKLQVMQDIANEAGLDWSPKAIEQQLYNQYNPPALKQNVRREEERPARRIEQVEPEECRLQNQERTPFKEIQMDYAAGKLQEPAESDGIVNFLGEESDDKKSLSYKSIPPPYHKSKLSQTRIQEEKQVPAEPENGTMHPPDDPDREVRQKPRSVRRLRWRPSWGNDDQDQPDEEERLIDRLLRYYSQKESPYGKGKTEQVQKPTPTFSSGKATRHQSWEMEVSARNSSSETNKRGHARAASLQPEMLNPGHVHPKLPDYDDFVARLASLRGDK